MSKSIGKTQSRMDINGYIETKAVDSTDTELQTEVSCEASPHLQNLSQTQEGYSDTLSNQWQNISYYSSPENRIASSFSMLSGLIQH